MTNYIQDRLCNRCGRAHIKAHFASGQFMFEEVQPFVVRRGSHTKQTRICTGEQSEQKGKEVL